MISLAPAVRVQSVRHAYGARTALDDVSLDVAPGEVFAFVGPNGGGKTTLFRLLATLLPVQQGALTVLGADVRTQPRAVRARIGVVFQHPSLDKMLTAEENVRCHAALFGFGARECRRRATESLAELGLAERARDRVGALSGGMQRRVELAKALATGPEALLLDEPTTGLDPGARSELWRSLRQLQMQHGTTIVLATHLLEEAERADRVAILHRGRLAAVGAPDDLRAEVGGDVVTIETADPAGLAAALRERFELPAQVIEDSVRIEVPEGCAWAARAAEAFPGRMRSVRVSQPSLEDVFIDKTGGRPHDEEELAGSPAP